MNKLISIIVPTMGKCEQYLKPLCNSIIKNTDLNKVEIIIVSNGSLDETDNYVLSLGNPFKLITFPTAQGYTRATNEGVKFSGGGKIIFLNNDVVILDFQNRHDWVNRLCEPLEDPMVGLTGPLMLHDSTIDNDFLIFMCAATRRDVWDKIGGLDEIFSPGGCEDIDYAMKVKQLGMRIQLIAAPKGIDKGLVVTDFAIYHVGEGSFGATKDKDGLNSGEGINDWENIKKKNYAILAERYPSLPDGSFWEKDIEQYRILANEVPDGGTIAELGTWKGRSLCSMADIIKRKKLKVIVVDTFAGSPHEPLAVAWAKQEDIEGIFRSSIERFGLSPTLFRMTTDEAANKISDGSLDLCFIDTDHSYECVKEDLRIWEKKIKSGGVLAGHDYSGPYYSNPSHPGVRKAVDEKYRDIHYDGVSLVWSKRL